MHIRHPEQHVSWQSSSNIYLSSKDGLKKKKKKKGDKDAVFVTWPDCVCLIDQTLRYRLSRQARFSVLIWIVMRMIYLGFSWSETYKQPEESHTYTNMYPQNITAYINPSKQHSMYEPLQVLHLHV